jgi:hypothetical protein
MKAAGCARGLGVLSLALVGAACGPKYFDAIGSDPCIGDPGAAGCNLPVVWPNNASFTNSDVWIRDNHDAISEMHPKLLVLDFFNGATLAQATDVALNQIAALAEGSRYHGYAVSGAPKFLNYQLLKVVDLADRPIPAGWSNPSSTLFPTDASGAFDIHPLFGQDFADRYLGISDPANGVRNLTLCELFEQGKVNEVWLEVGESGARANPNVIENRRNYDAYGTAIPGSFTSLGCNNCISCGVTVRMAHLNPHQVTDCDLQVRGWGIENLGSSIPYLATNAAAFLNRDFRKFGVPFDGWADICQGGTDCVTYPSPSSAASVGNTTGAWRIDPFVQGCGSTLFPPNATHRWDFAGTVPVHSRCENYQMHNGRSGEDVLDTYTRDKIAAYDQVYNSSCGGGGGWQIYWRQSIPGYANTAHDLSGNSMKNWWPFLFY